MNNTQYKIANSKVESGGSGHSGDIIPTLEKGGKRILSKVDLERLGIEGKGKD